MLTAQLNNDNYYNEKVIGNSMPVKLTVLTWTNIIFFLKFCINTIWLYGCLRVFITAKKDHDQELL